MFAPKHGCFVIKDFWQPRLMDIPAIVFPILIFCCDCWLDSRNSNKGFSPFLLMDGPWTLFRFCFCCVVKRSLCMFARRTPILSSSLKLHENLHNNDIGNEVYICCEIATMTNEGEILIYIGKNKTFYITKTNTSCRT